MEGFKSIVAWLLSPFIIGVAIQSAGLLRLISGRHGRAAKVLLAAGTVVLLVGGLPVLAHDANRRRELVHEPFQITRLADPAKPALVVVLGGGFNPDPWLSPTSRLDSTVTARMIEGVRVFRMLPDARLYVSFAGDDGTPDEMRATLRELAAILALDPARVHAFTGAESTADEARMTAAVRKQGERVIIVTSASHMPRAMITFAGHDMDPVAAPTDFRHARRESRTDKPWKRWIPSTAGHGESQQWLYESVATLARRIGLM
jgi:uncharacterized SAM-binding protein YcdF (DUF218 family)